MKEVGIETQIAGEIFVGYKKLMKLQAEIARMYEGNLELRCYQQRMARELEKDSTVASRINSTYGCYLAHQQEQLLKLKCKAIDLQLTLQFNHDSDD